MASTEVLTDTVQIELDNANPNTLASALQLVKLGSVLGLLKATMVGLTPAATYDITKIPPSASAGYALNKGALADDGGTALPPIGAVKSLRVTAATTATVVGTYGISDAAGTVVSPATHTVMGIALLSDDGKTLTFASADVTAFVIEYYPAPAVALTATYAPFTGQ